MGIDLASYRQSIGLWIFIASPGKSASRRSGLVSASPARHCSLPFSVLLLFLLLRADALPCHGDVERNPGPSTSLAATSTVSRSNLNLTTNHKVNRESTGGHGSAASSGLTVAHFNARSLLPKVAELSFFLSTVPADIVAVTETWLSSSVPDGAILVPGYDVVFRADHPCGHRGGGVLLLVKSGIRCWRRQDLEVWSESIWIEVQSESASSRSRHGQRSIIVGCFYRPPSTDPADFAVALEEPWRSLWINFHIVLRRMWC